METKGQMRVETIDLTLPAEDVVLTHPVQLKWFPLPFHAMKVQVYDFPKCAVLRNMQLNKMQQQYDLHCANNVGCEFNLIYMCLRKFTVCI